MKKDWLDYRSESHDSFVCCCKCNMLKAVENLDNPIQLFSRESITFYKHWIVIHPVDSINQLLNNWSLMYDLRTIKMHF